MNVFMTSQTDLQCRSVETLIVEEGSRQRGFHPCGDGALGSRLCHLPLPRHQRSQSLSKDTPGVPNMLSLQRKKYIQHWVINLMLTIFGA
jgi:hypothetical protein